MSTTHTGAIGIVRSQSPDELDPLGPVGTVRLLGNAAFEVHGRLLRLPKKAFVLLAILVLAPGYTARRTVLRSILWGDSRHDQSAANLRQLLSRIGRVERHTGCRLIEVDGGDVRLTRGGARIDAAAVTPAALRDVAADPDRLATALRGNAGELLADYAPAEDALDAWLTRERSNLQVAYTTAATALLRSGTASPGDELEIAGRLLAWEPTLEIAHRARIRAFGARGDLNLARAAFRDCRRSLMDALGVSPSPETMALVGRYFDAAGGSNPPGGPRSLATDDAGRPRIAILPPVHPFDDRRVGDLCGFLLEELTIGLARYRSFRVIAAHTAMAVASGAARDIDVRDWSDYVVGSTLSTTSGSPEIRFRLTDARSNEVVWAAAFSVDADDLPDLSASLADQSVRALADAVERREVERPSTSEDRTAYRLYLEGRRFAASTSLPEVRRSRRLFRAAARRDPGFAAARAGIARTLSLEWLIRGAPAPEFLLDAVREADAAIDADDRDARGYREKGHAMLYLKRHEESLALFGEAAKRNPNDADLLADHADALAHSGRAETALPVLDRAATLSPEPPQMHRWIRASILHRMRRYHDAIAVLDRDRRDPATARLLAACHARIGEAATARGFVRLSRQSLPGFATADLWRLVPNRHAEDTRHYAEGLVLAGFA